MRRRSLLTASVVVITGAAALTGCSGSGGPSSDPDAPAEMTLWQNATTGPGLDFWEETVAGFEDANPNVTIDLQTVQNEDFDGRLQTALNSGDAPDIFLQRGGGKLQAQVEAGFLKDITDGITDETRQLVPEASLQTEAIDDKIYGMPLSVLPSGFWYSQDAFDEAGIEAPPATIEELTDAVAALKDAGIQPIALGAKDAWPAAHWYYNFALRACAPEVMQSTAESLTFDDPCWEKAGDDLQSFVDTEPFNDGFLTTAAQQGAGSSAGLVANRKAAMELMGAWDPGVIASLTPDEKPLPDLAWFPFPTVSGGNGPEGAIMGGVDGYSCSADSPPACVDFLNYLAGTERQEAYYAGFSTPPVNTEAQTVVEEPYLQQVLTAYNDAPYVSQWLDTLYGLNVGNALNVSVVNLLAGQGDAAGIVKATNDAAKRG